MKIIGERTYDKVEFEALSGGISNQMQLAEQNGHVLSGTLLKNKDGIIDILGSQRIELIEKPESRHSVTNKTTELLDKLEVQFEGNEQELEKIRKISVVDDYHIIVGGFTHKLGVCSAPANPLIGICDYDGQTLFTHKAATDFASTQTGYKMYSKSEMEALMDAIPGKTTSNQAKIILELLQIPPFAGCRFPGDYMPPEFRGTFLWTSDLIDCKSSICFLYISNKNPVFKTLYVNDACSLILRKET